MSRVNSYTGAYHSSLIEAINSKATNRVVNRRNLLEAPYYNPTKDDYNFIAFGVDLIAATYGITEKKLIQLAFGGRENLVYSLSRISGEEPNRVGSYIDFIEMNLSSIYEMINPSKGQTPISKQNRINIISESMASILYATVNHSNFWLVNQRGLYPQHAREVDNDFQFSMSNIYYIMNRVYQMYSSMFQYDFSRDVPYRASRLGPAYELNGSYCRSIGFSRSNILAQDVVERHRIEDFSEDMWDNWKVTIHINRFLAAEYSNPILSRTQAMLRKARGEEMLDFRYVPMALPLSPGVPPTEQKWVIRDTMAGTRRNNVDGR